MHTFFPVRLNTANGKSNKKEKKENTRGEGTMGMRTRSDVLATDLGDDP